MIWSRRRETVNGADSLPSTVIPDEPKHTGTDLLNVHHENVAWSHMVEPGVRVYLELRTTSDLETYIESVRVTDVGDGHETTLNALNDGEHFDAPVGGTFPVSGTVAEDACDLCEPGCGDCGDDSDKDASPDVHEVERIAWGGAVSRLLMPRQVLRLSLIAEAVAL